MAKVKKTIKTIISEGIKNGWTKDRILKAVKKDHPESKADESHVKYYSGQLKRAGEISDEVHEKYAGKKGRGNTAGKKPAAKKSAKKTADKKPAAKKPAKKTAVKETTAKKPRKPRKAAAKPEAKKD